LLFIRTTDRMHLRDIICQPQQGSKMPYTAF